MKNNKHKLFADEYLIDMNASRAYVAAGYSSKTPEKNAYKLLQVKEVKEYIQAEQAKVSKNLSKTREDIIVDLTDIINEYKLSGKLTTNTLKAIDILNRMAGWYEADKSEVTHKGINITINKPKK